MKNAKIQIQNRKYYKTVYTGRYNIILLRVGSVTIGESFCLAYDENKKRASKKMQKVFDGYYFNAELQSI